MTTAHQQPSRPPKQTDVGRYLGLLDGLSASNTTAYHTVATEPPVDINSEIVREQRLKNDNVEQDIKLKRETLNRLFTFLAIETAVIFTFAFFQGAGWPAHFHLEDWSFKLLVTATILQITGMLYVAVRYLFPKGT